MIVILNIIKCLFLGAWLKPSLKIRIRVENQESVISGEELLESNN